MAEVKTSAASRFSHITAAIAHGASYVSVMALIAITLTMAADSILRYVFKIPFKGGNEIVEVALVVVVFMGIAFTHLRGGHSSVNLLYVHLKTPAQRVMDSVNALIMSILLILIIWNSFLRAIRTWEGNEASPGLFIPIAPFMMIVALGSAIWLLVVLSNLVKSSSAVLQGDSSKARFWLFAGSAISLIVIVVVAWPLLPFRFDPMAFGIIGLLLIVPVLATNMPVGFVLMLLALLGLGSVQGIRLAMISFGQVPFTESSDYSMSIIPLFIFMGELVYVFGLGQDLFAAAHKWLARLPGGLASATVGACAGFASICGSTVATAATMATVALPEMKRYNYQPALATGCCAGGGIIGTMIPPSIAFVIYGIITEQSIGKLFMAGIVPGILMTLVFIGIITLRCWRNPTLGPPGPSSSWREKIVALKDVVATLFLFIFVMGGIYTGIFTAIEAGGMGVIGALVIGAVLRRFTMANFLKAAQTTIVITGMVFLLFIGATIFAKFIALSRLPFVMATFITEVGLSPVIFIIFVLFIFLLFGCVMPAFPVMILLVPIFFPAVQASGFDPIWFGVMMILMSEIGGLTPPVGIDVYTVAGIAKDIPMSTIFRGVAPFVIGLLLLAGILLAFPQIATFLPDMLK